MAKGLPYKVIAAQLNVTTRTIQYHVTNILQKLHVGNRGEAVAVAVQRGYATDEMRPASVGLLSTPTKIPCSAEQGIFVGAIL